MDFDLTQEQRQLRDRAREFSRDMLAPAAREQDEREEFPHEQYREATKQGFFGLLVPKEYGGLGADTVSYALVMEEISRGHAAFGVPLSVHSSLVCYPIAAHGTPEQKQRYLPRLASGELLGGFALTEPESGSDASAMHTIAEERDSGWLLNGTKTFISMGGTGGLFVVMAISDPANKPSHSISAFIIERDAPGLITGRKLSKMGMRATDTTELLLNNVSVSAESVLGERGGGFKLALSALDSGRIGIAAQAIGIAQAALDESLKYATYRRQFGQPISEFEAIRFKLADMATEIEAARLLTLEAAFLKDSGRSYTQQAAMAKLLASHVAVRAADEAVQIHGGYGYIKDFTVERLYRDAKVTEIYEGTSEIQRLVIAERLLAETP